MVPPFSHMDEIVPWWYCLKLEANVMIRITRQTDYGILLLSQMAAHPLEAVLTAKDAAKRSGIPLPMASKILKSLAREGLLASHRGVKGGYSLAVAPEMISLGDVIEALEGPIGITECSHTPGACEQESGCPVRTNWLRISITVKEALDRIPLSEMASPPEVMRARLVPLSQIGVRA